MKHDKYYSYLCKCPKCGRRFFYTFKFNPNNLIVNKDGMIEWKCFGCSKKEKNSTV